ncbi:helix-turn-helix domain-containing protein, partial [Myxococcota bacterium]|nr:helix-turn-helix domain-containing protein [Myxococcota bacterium]
PTLGLDGPPRPPVADPERAPAAPMSMRDAERAALVQALERSNGNKSLAARMLGISRKQLYAKIALFGLE